MIVLAQLQVIHRHHLRGSPRSLLLVTMLCTTGAAEDRKDILESSESFCEISDVQKDHNLIVLIV